jgi:hypothetical protein
MSEEIVSRRNTELENMKSPDSTALQMQQYLKGLNGEEPDVAQLLDWVAEIRNWWGKYCGRETFEMSKAAAFAIAKRVCYVAPTPDDAKRVTRTLTRQVGPLDNLRTEQYQSEETLTPIWIGSVDSEDFDVTVYDPEYQSPEESEGQEPGVPYADRLKALHLDVDEDGIFSVYIDGYG